MENKKLKSIMQDALEKEISPAQIELWPAVKNRLVARKHPLFRQGENMHTTLFIRRTALTTLALIIAVSLLAFTPHGRALAKNLLSFFTRTEGDSLPVPTPQPTELGQGTDPLPAPAAFADDCGEFSMPTCSVEQVRAKVNFTIKEPARFPDEMYFVGATGSPEEVILFYNAIDQSQGVMLFAKPLTDLPATPFPVGQSASIEPVSINGLPGEYVRGAFAWQSQDVEAAWNSDFGMETLRWVDGKTIYTLEYFAYQSQIGKEKLIEIAESMTSEPVVWQATPIPDPTEAPWNPKNDYPLGIAEVEEKSGFSVVLPPESAVSLPLIGANYQAEGNITQVFYYSNEYVEVENSIIAEFTKDGDTVKSDFKKHNIATNPSITLSQQAAPNPADCFLCDVLVGDSQMLQSNSSLLVVPPEATVEIVPLGDITGKYVEGVWQGTDCCGWQWVPDPMLSHLRWWKNGMAFEIMSMGVSKEDLLKIARAMVENMK
ncbi:MAG: hypothetical protein CVU44_22480 [Chloroflexi bacterium HGW-Chloroflexi-6]|nr:MAG: hypothetical protein CVU44_22480 [Chloroflexi bacterium HGW-Chloroflexi-6]